LQFLIVVIISSLVIALLNNKSHPQVACRVVNLQNGF
jgi:hypothetical protein